MPLHNPWQRIKKRTGLFIYLSITSSFCSCSFLHITSRSTRPWNNCVIPSHLSTRRTSYGFEYEYTRRGRISAVKASKNDEEDDRKWKAQFQSMPSMADDDSNAVDVTLSFLTSDRFSVVVGFIGLIVCLINRLGSDFDSIETLSGVQSRSDLLAVVACGSVLLNGLTQLDVTSALADTVQLEGEYYNIEVYGGDSNTVSAANIDVDDAKWVLESLLTTTPASSAVLLKGSSKGSNEQNTWKVIASGGVLPYNLCQSRKNISGGKTPILNRFLRQGDSRSETYLPTLQALPGKAEFQYLPANTQAALLLPVSGLNEYVDDKNGRTVLVLGADTAKSFSPRDVAWCQSITTRI
mmetsp:Transcript_17088/g.22179  ORF Transcript_17088/g.22179 Transcript_17088/m.22179 type:complete len:352 (-) Transcript_17088:118-1173(-)